MLRTYTKAEARKVLKQACVTIPLSQLCQIHPEILKEWPHGPQPQNVPVAYTMDKSTCMVTRVGARAGNTDITDALLDTGASACILSLDLVQELGMVADIEGPGEQFRTAGTGSCVSCGRISNVPLGVGSCTIQGSSSREGTTRMIHASL